MSCPKVQHRAAQPKQGQGSLPALLPAPLLCLHLCSACCFAGALEIRQALPGHSGRYTCTARSAAGTARKHIWLTVHGMHTVSGFCCWGFCSSSHSSTSLLFTEPPALKPLPGMVMVMVNTSAVLNCEATGVPRPEVTWQKDGVGITGGEQECAGGWQSPHYLPAFT